jgi:hypothetical protein
MAGLRAIASAARAWRDPDYGPRRAATGKTLAADNRFTREAVVFAVNQQMSQINVAALERWLGAGITGAEPQAEGAGPQAEGAEQADPVRQAEGAGPGTDRAEMAPVVAVLEPGNVPLAGLQDYLAVTGSGAWFRGAVSSRSPYLLPAFAEDVAERGGPRATFAPYAELLRGADALIASGSDETVAGLASDCKSAGMAPERCLLRGNRFSVAVIDGGEHEEQRLRLAEDALLHEGMGCRNVAVIFAPEDLDADPYFEALSVFRGTFPAHPQTGGALKMQQAFLKAVDAPHAYGEGLEYLVSRGDPDVQPPGHIRWVCYESVQEVNDWLSGHLGNLQIVCARSAVRKRLIPGVEGVALGQAQRPPLDWKADGKDVVSFLDSLRDP